MVRPALHKNNNMNRTTTNSEQHGGNVKRALFFTAVGVVCGAAAYHTARKLRGQPTREASVVVKDVKYVFPTTGAKPVTLPEKELKSIFKMYESGIQADKIAAKFNLSKANILRIINSNVIE